MTTPEALNALADRVERDEATWELTCEIEIALNPNARRSTNALYAVRSGLGMYNPPAYLHSLDAAETLEPKDAQEICVRKYANGGHYVRITMASGGVVYSESFDRPLLEAAARTAAALRARAADMQARPKTATHPPILAKKDTTK